jgi:sugar lactone lactonase YvrE
MRRSDTSPCWQFSGSCSFDEGLGAQETRRQVLAVPQRIREQLALYDLSDLSGLTEYYLKALLIDPAGRAYISCSGFDDQPITTPQPARLILVETNGTARPVGSNLLFANGMAITPDRRTLIVAETYSQRLSAFDIADDGTLGRHRVWARLTGLMPGGLCLDCEGAVWVASPLSSQVLRVREGSEIPDRIPVPGNPTVCSGWQ